MREPLDIFVFAGAGADHQRHPVELAQRGGAARPVGPLDNHRTSARTELILAAESPLTRSAAGVHTLDTIPGALIRPSASCGVGLCSMNETVISDHCVRFGAALLVRSARCRLSRHGANGAPAAPRSGAAGAAQPGLRAAGEPARRRSTAARSIPPTRRPDQALRGRRATPAGRARPPQSRRRGAWAAKAAASSRCSAVSRRNAARSTTRSQQTRANLDRLLGDLQRLQGNSADREGQRRSILARARAERLRSAIPPVRQSRRAALLRKPVRRRHHHQARDAARLGGDTYRTRLRAHLRRLLLPDLLFDVAGKLRRGRAGLCRRMCPAAEVELYTHRNPGEDIAQATSTGGQQLFRTAERIRLSARRSTPPAVAGRRARPGRRRSSTSTTRPSSAATSS